MKRVFWILGAVLTLVVAVVISFNARSVLSFVVGTIVSALVIFGVFTLMIKSVENARQNNKEKAIVLGIVAVIVIAIFIFSVVSLPRFISLQPSPTPAHFRTNILTGQCDYGGDASHISSDPWYYKPDCSNESEKINALRDFGDYRDKQQECDMFCEESNTERYCGKYRRNSHGNGPTNVNNCSLITNCSSISCDSSQQ